MEILCNIIQLISSLNLVYCLQDRVTAGIHNVGACMTHSIFDNPCLN
jgi:hypothetical protein